jgi:extradiol dioxygenase family protein
MQPILHLSLPVADLETSKAFYVDVLGCDLARECDGFIDVWFYGLQLTLHAQPTQVLAPEQRGVRHFGVTLGGHDLAALLSRLDQGDVEWASRVRTDYAGTPREQTKAKIVDPSGNVIELKTYADPAGAFTLPSS